MIISTDDAVIVEYTYHDNGTQEGVTLIHCKPGEEKAYLKAVGLFRVEVKKVRKIGALGV
jgi:hypothetical protein